LNPIREPFDTFEWSSYINLLGVFGAHCKYYEKIKGVAYNTATGNDDTKEFCEHVLEDEDVEE
jgi:hypothetical protein